MILLDTHTWFWAISDPDRLSSEAKKVIEVAGLVYVSPVSAFEIAQKMRAGKWPEAQSWIKKLMVDNIIEAPLTVRASFLSGALDWDHRDPFDRLIAAVAIDLKCPLVSADDKFDEINHPDWRGRIWKPK